MYLKHYRFSDGRHDVDVHHGGRVRVSAHYWPWQRWWRIAVWRGSYAGLTIEFGRFEVRIG